MQAAAAVTATAPRLSIEALRSALLWLMGFAGAFVFIEPSPYEIVGVVAIAIVALTGLALRAPLVPMPVRRPPRSDDSSCRIVAPEGRKAPSLLPLIGPTEGARRGLCETPRNARLESASHVRSLSAQTIFRRLRGPICGVALTI